MSPFPLLHWHEFLSRSATGLQKLSAIWINGSLTLSTEPVVKNSLKFLDMTPNISEIHLFDIAAGGHRFTRDILLTNKLDLLVLRSCGISRRLLRKVLHGQQLTKFEYLPVPNQVAAVAGGYLSAPDLVALLTNDKVSLKELVLFPAGCQLELTSLKMFENLEILQVPHPGVLDMFAEELDSESISSFLEQSLHLLYAYCISVILASRLRPGT